jgi:hypothetical protein
MSTEGVEPEVFAGAASETAKDEARERDVEIAASFSADSVRHLERSRVKSQVEASGEIEHLDERVHEQLPGGGRRTRRNIGARLTEGDR